MSHFFVYYNRNIINRYNAELPAWPDAWQAPGGLPDQARVHIIYGLVCRPGQARPRLLAWL